MHVLLGSVLLGWMVHTNLVYVTSFLLLTGMPLLLMKKIMSVPFIQFLMPCPNLPDSFADEMLQALWYFGLLRCQYSNMFQVSWPKTALAIKKMFGAGNVIGRCGVLKVC